MVGFANCGLANYTRIEPSAVSNKGYAVTAHDSHCVQEVTTTQVVLAALPQNAPYLGCLYQMRVSYH